MTKPFELTAKQEAAQAILAGLATHGMLFGGSRSGKTFLHVRNVVLRALKAPKSRHAILRFRFNHIKTAIIFDTFPKVMDLCFPGVEYVLSRTDWYVLLPNESEIWFGGLDDKERTEKILGQEYVTILFNECSQIPQGSRDIAITRLAQQVEVSPGKFLTPRAFYDLNPTNKMHWAYQMFVKKVDPETKKPLPNAQDFVYYQINPEDNIQNLSAGYLKTLEALPARLQKRFLRGEFADATEHALFSDDNIDTWRVTDGELPDMQRIVVAVDPSGADDTGNEGNDAIGIAVCGLGIDGNGYLLEDLTVKAGPATWGRIVVEAYVRHEADAVVGETNFGGAMVQHVIRTAAAQQAARVNYRKVTASRGKVVRAEPISALYEQGKIRHVGYHRELEEEMSAMTTRGYVGEGSPNRVDSMVWGFSFLFPGILKPPKDKNKSSEAKRHVPYVGQAISHSWMGA